MIVWTALALQDIQDAVLYISESSERAADRVGSAILAAGESLTYFPKRGRYGKQNGTRELIVQSTPYYLVYRITRDGDIVIRRVMHMARDWPRRR
jgi:plasmid stabilization system protein ParE